MAKVYSNGVTLPTGFKRQFPAPGFDDEIWEFIDDLNTIPNQFVGMEVFILENETKYILKSDGWKGELSINDQGAANETEIINITSLELVSNTLTLGADSEWKIQGENYTNVADFWLNIPNAATGQKRRDRVLLDQDNKMVLLQGAEHPVKAFLKPYNQKLFIEISQTDVDGASINVQPIELNAYVKKNEFGINLLSTNNASEIIIINEKSGYVLSGSQEVINYIADFPNNSPLFDGKEFFIYNNQSIPITLKNEYSTSSATARKFKFKDGNDYILKPLTGLKVKWIANLNRLIVVSMPDDYIPLSGTEVGKPITGDLEMGIYGDNGNIYFNDGTYIHSLKFDDGNMFLESKEISTGDKSSFLNSFGSVRLFSENDFYKGISGNTVFDKQNDPNAFAQLGDIAVTNETATPLSLATLNSTYAIQGNGFKVICPAINLIYIKSSLTTWEQIATTTVS